MHLTPNILRAAYNYLRDTPPFHRWKMPEADEVGFIVAKTKRVYGECTISKPKDKRFRSLFNIAVSCDLVKSTDVLMETMAHEMCHIKCELLGSKSVHGYEFKRLAKSVCKQHGWREETF